MTLDAVQRLELEHLTTPRLSAYVPIVPTDKQAAALLIDARELFYGGAAGGGKSDYLLAAALQYADVPGYAALLLRRTFAQLSKAGGLLERSHQWLGPTDAKWNGLERTWAFPSGARLEFGQLQHEHTKYDYQSAAYQFVGFDELTHFTESQYRYVGFSRVRRTEGLAVPLRTRSASNPGGLGHDWVKRRCITERRQNGCVYLSAKLSDNPYLAADEYAEGLLHLDPITREQLLNGDWTARALGGFFRREWFPVVEQVLAQPATGPVLRYWDLASTAPKAGTDPDYTVGCRMRKTKGALVIEDVARWRKEPAPTEDGILATARADGPKCTQWLEQEPGASGKYMANQLRQRLHREVGCPVRLDRPTGPKAERARPLASRAHAGEVSLMDGDWVGEFLDEMDSFGPDCPHDDQVDAASGACKAHTAGWGWDQVMDLEGEADADAA